MSVILTPRTKKYLIALLIVGLIGIAIRLAWNSSELSKYATIVVTVIFVIVARLASKSSLSAGTSDVSTPLFRFRSNLPDIGKGLLCVLAAFAWAVLVGLSGRMAAANDSELTAALIMAPSVALLVLGIVFLALGIFRDRG
jgi:hypothetical protein